MLYFEAFAIGHLAFVNQLINSYRRVSIDPCATEVSEWDVPTWFVECDNSAFPVYIFPYGAEDTRPEMRNTPQDSVPQAYVAATLHSIRHCATTAVVPGEVELLDGSSLYYRGRYGDSIRSLVTAVEVLLETRIRDEYRASGVAPEIVDTRLAETRNNFGRRLGLYCEITDQRVPGPILSWIPYLNGIRLADHLEQTRSLRHEIVHGGKRLDHSLRNPMRRAAETTTWFFDWLSGNGDFSQRQLRHYSFFESQRGGFCFEFEIQPDGVTVLPLTLPPLDEMAEPIVIESLEPGEIPTSLLIRSLGGTDGQEKDVEHFTQMAFARLGIDSVVDSPPHPRGIPLPHFDRFRITVHDRLTLVFLLDTHEHINNRDVEQIAAAVAIRYRQSLEISSVLCIINDQNGMPWLIRSADTVSVECARIAEACSIALVKADDLLRLALGVREYDWARDVAFQSLLRPGWNGREPPNATFLGTVRHFYSKMSIVSIQLAGEAEMRIGETLVFRLRARFHQEPIISIQQNRVNVVHANNGNVGVPISLARHELPIGADVYLIKARLPSRTSGLTESQQPHEI